MKLLAALILSACLASPALAQHERHWRHDGAQRPMPPPERRLGWEERQRLRDQVRSGQMSREEARERMRETRGVEPGRFSREQRDQLRRDVIDANRSLERR